MSVEERVAKTVESVRSGWAVCVTATSLWILFTKPLWWLLPLIGIATIAYFVALFIAGMWLSYRIPQEELIAAVTDNAEAEFLEISDDEDPTDEQLQMAGLTLGEVSDTSTAIGRYMDEEIFDWIDVLVEPNTTKRFFFESVTPRDKDGNMLLPNEVGFACYQGSIYKMIA
jgi:hypothetical protein